MKEDNAISEDVKEVLLDCLKGFADR